MLTQLLIGDKDGYPEYDDDGNITSKFRISGGADKIITEDMLFGPYTPNELLNKFNEVSSSEDPDPELYSKGHVWIKYVDGWMVNYNANGGVGSMKGSLTQPVTSSLTLPDTTYLRFGYRFIGWTTQPGLVSDSNPLLHVGESYRPSDAKDGSKYTLYAQWEQIGGTENQPVTGQSGMLPGWYQVDSENTRNDIIPNYDQNVSFLNRERSGSTALQFKFTKLLDDNIPDKGKSFQFELYDVDQGKVIQTTKSMGAIVQFKPITYQYEYDSNGEYVLKKDHTYYVRESSSDPNAGVNNDPNLNYDNHLVEVKVTVTDEDNENSGGKLKAVAQITGDTTFKNESKPASLDITKTVDGVTDGMSPSHKDKDFKFNVQLLDRSNQPVNGKTYTTTITQANSDKESGSPSGTSSSESTADHISFDSTGNATVSVKAGQKLTINGIPAYYKYTVKEIDVPAGYENTSLTNPTGILEANSSVIVNAVNHYSVTPASVSLQAGKSLLAPGNLTQSVNNGEFRFTLCEVNADGKISDANGETEDSSGFTSTGDASNASDASCTGVAESTNDGNGFITFPQITYDIPGVHEYQIREVKGNTLDMRYDSTVYTATVTVTDDGSGKLVSSITYRNNTTGATTTPTNVTSWDPNNPSSMGVPVFVNRTRVANRLPITGGNDVIIASVVLAMVLAIGLFFVMNRRREEE